jgi:hypothetical protein
MEALFIFLPLVSCRTTSDLQAEAREQQKEPPV